MNTAQNGKNSKMTTFKPGQRVKIFYKADGGYGLGTVRRSGLYNGIGVVPDDFDETWHLDSFRIELVKKLEGEGDE